MSDDRARQRTGEDRARPGRSRTTASVLGLLGTAWDPVRETLLEWYDDSAPRWSAAIAFYTLFSLAPILIVSFAVARLFWDDGAVRNDVLSRFSELIGERGAQQIGGLIDRSLPAGAGGPATVLAAIALIVGATLVFATVRQALNTVWGVNDAGPGGLWGIVRGRLLAAAVLVGLALLVVLSLVASAVVSGWGGALEERFGMPLPLVRFGELAVSFVALGLLFAMLFRWLPDAEIAWRDVWVGAALTAALLLAGRGAIGWFLGRYGLASAYGVAGSIVLLLLWVYYSAMIFLLGAEATEVVARRRGARIGPARKNHPSRDRFVTRDPG